MMAVNYIYIEECQEQRVLRVHSPVKNFLYYH